MKTFNLLMIVTICLYADLTTCHWIMGKGTTQPPQGTNDEVTTQPITTDKVATQPRTAHKATTQPTTHKATTQPTTHKARTQPTTDKATTQPTTHKATTQPGTTYKATTQLRTTRQTTTYESTTISQMVSTADYDETEGNSSDCCGVDLEFIKKREGFSRTGYVPDGPGNSGVTIGNGVDLGSKDEAYFKKLGCPQSIIDKLKPYFGLKLDAARNKLKQKPLTLTKEEADKLSMKVMKAEIERIKELYDAAIAQCPNGSIPDGKVCCPATCGRCGGDGCSTRPGGSHSCCYSVILNNNVSCTVSDAPCVLTKGAGKKKWDELTDAQRTVIASVLFQYHHPSRVPKFWQHVTNQDWQKVEEELRDFKDKYPTRRNLEADLLKNDSGVNSCGKVSTHQPHTTKYEATTQPVVTDETTAQHKTTHKATTQQRTTHETTMQPRTTRQLITTDEVTSTTTPQIMTTADYNETQGNSSDCCGVDLEFIKEREGFSRTGYVPDGPGNSGVTIGNGIDLGSKDEAYFKNLGCPQSLIDKLKPYFGLKLDAARNKLKQKPLTLTKEEADKLSMKVMKAEVERIKELYDAAVGPDKKKWDELTDAQRTVIASVLFQYHRPSRVPKFWQHVINQDWQKVEDELRDFKDLYPTRRNLEADLLKNDTGLNSCSTYQKTKRKLLEAVNTFIGSTDLPCILVTRDISLWLELFKDEVERSKDDEERKQASLIEADEINLCFIRICSILHKLKGLLKEQMCKRDNQRIDESEKFDDLKGAYHTLRETKAEVQKELTRCSGLYNKIWQGPIITKQIETLKQILKSVCKAEDVFFECLYLD